MEMSMPFVKLEKKKEILIKMSYSTAYLRLYKDCTLLKDQKRALSPLPGLFPFLYFNQSICSCVSLSKSLSYCITVMTLDHLSKIMPLTP